MMKFPSLLFFLCLCLAVNTNGQSPPPPPPNLLPTITTPSPEVAAFSRYGNYEVNLFNGTPDISIPLYEINVGGLKVPISINYSASGIRVTDISTNIGCGWSLNAGGTITRKVMGGMPDENASFGYLNGGTIQNLSNNSFDPGSTLGLQYLRDVADNYRMDPEPDIFSYNISGRSGKFVFTQENGLKPFFIPYEPLTVSYALTGGSTMTLGMTDESGISYQFNTYETSQNSGQFNPSMNIISSWLMTQMLSANAQDTIKFNYSNAPGLNQTFLNDNLTVIDQVYTDNNYLQYPVYYATPDNAVPTFGVPSLAAYTYSSINQKNLDSIRFRNGKIVFQVAPEARQDIGSKHRLQRIDIYGLQGSTYTLIKEIELYHSYFIRYASYGQNFDSTQTRRLRLDSLVIRDGSGTNIQKYKFGYNTRTDNYGLPDPNAKAIDYWGYYNGKFANTLVPRTDIMYSPSTQSIAVQRSVGASFYGTRDPDPTFMQADILNKITYPTGGYTLFSYETNQYSSTNLPANAAFAGGLRIKKIESYDGLSPTPLTKTYIYGQNESGFGLKNFTLNNYFFQTTQSHRYWSWSPPYDPNNPNQLSSPILTATEIIRTFLSNPTIDIEPYDATPVAYPYVTEYIGDGTNNTGKTIYQFNNMADWTSYYQAIGTSSFIFSNHFHRGQILFKTGYKQNSDKSYTIVSQTENHYAAFPDSTRSYSALAVTHNMYSDGLPINKQQNIQTLDQELPPANSSGIQNFNGTMEYFSLNYGIQSGDKRLTQTIERTYDQTDPTKLLATTTNYYYDNFSHMQPTRIVTTNSKSETLTDSLKYPTDFAQAGNVYQTMVSKNILDKVIQDKKTNNMALVSLQLNNYADAGNGNLLPQNIQVQVAANPVETRANFLSYDQYGNVLGMQKTNDIIQSYVWDYKNVSPVAMAVNASSNQIAATSFEADGKGNWTFNGTPVADATSPTGSKVYPLTTSYPVSKSGLQTSGTYIVSYWSKSGSYTVTGSTGMRQGRTSNGWTYYEHTVTGTTTVAVSGTGSLDELRLYPSMAQMTTYTYAPLVGVTSACDANNKISYYFYDAFGRLKWIKDQDGNIIKTMQYHYEGISGLLY